MGSVNNEIKQPTWVKTDTTALKTTPKPTSAATPKDTIPADHISLENAALLKKMQDNANESMRLAEEGIKQLNPKTEKGVAFVVTNHELHGGGNETTYGIRAEKELEPLWSKKSTVGETNFTSVKLTPIAGKSLNFGSHSFNVSPGIGLKLQAGLGEAANVYTSAMGTVNVGVLGGDLTAGVGVRGAVGAELGPLYVEGFTEKATNYCSTGFATGIRLMF